MARAIEVIRKNFDKPLRIEDLASKLCMSVSGFHALCKTVTAMSPLQFQKQLRLQEARRVMLNKDFDAAQADAKNGVLTVRMPKRRAAQPRTIPIRPS